MACDRLFRTWADTIGTMYAVPHDIVSILPDVARNLSVQSASESVMADVARMMIRLVGWTDDHIRSPHPISPATWYRMAHAMLASNHPVLASLARTVLRYAGEFHWTEKERDIQTMITQLARDGERTTPSQDYWTMWKTQESVCRMLGAVPIRTKSGWKVGRHPLTPEERMQRLIESYRTVPPTDTPPIPAPPGKEYTPFQRASIATIARRRYTLLADEPGLGKTIQAIGVMNVLGSDSCRRVLVVCPAFLRRHWSQTIREWDVHDRVVGTDMASISSLPPDRPLVVVLSYEQMVRWKEQVQGMAWDMVVFDEAHYLKNPQAMRSKVAWAIPAHRIVAMTGTPMVNRPRELWPFCRALDRDGLGSDWRAFHRRYCGLRQTRWGWEYDDATNIEELSTLLRSTFMIARQKRYITDIPPKHVYAVLVEPDASPEYTRARKDEERLLQRVSERRLSHDRPLADLDGVRDGLWTIEDLATLNRTRQIVGMAKVPLVVAQATSILDSGEKVVIATWHREVAEAIGQALATSTDETPPHTSVIVTGEMDGDRRQQVVDRFQTDPATRVLVTTIGALGVGVTLTAARHMIIAELPWTPGAVEQMIDRVHRIGQHGEVTAQLICADGTIDGFIATHIAEKGKHIRTLMQ